MIGILVPATSLISNQNIYADSKDVVCQGIGLTGPNGTCNEDTSGPTVDSLIKTVISILSYLVGIAAIIMLILGGLKYVSSAGDSTKVKSAKDTIMYALIGVLIAALAQVLVRYVLTQATTTPAAEVPEQSALVVPVSV